MTVTPYTDQDPGTREVARGAARNALRRLLLGHLGDQIADAIADEVLDAALAQIVADRISIPGSEGYGNPVHWTVYNAMHERALYSGYVIDKARATYRRLRAHLAGFQDALDDIDAGAWTTTGAAAMHELGTLLGEDAGPTGDELSALPEWLYQWFARNRPHAPGWDSLSDGDRDYWAHEAAAVRRAVDRGGSKTPGTAPGDGAAER